MNVKKTKKFKENRPENYHVHDILVEGYQAPMEDQVVHRQPLLQDIAEVLFRVL